MNKYEGLFIFPESLKSEELETAVAGARADIEKAGGRIENMTRLGKRAFARTMNKQGAGHYVVIYFSLAGEKLSALQARYRLNEQVFRFQIIRVKEFTLAVAAGAAEEKSAHAATE